VPRPSNLDQVALHNAPEYSAHPYFDDRRRDRDLQRRRSDMVLEEVGAATSLVLAGGRMLDVGCDTGAFMEACAAFAKMEPWGMDISAWAIEQARARGLPVHCGSLEDAPPAFRGFRLITAIDVIEHTADPLSFLVAARARLAPGGVLFLQTPNARSVVYAAGRLVFRATGGRPRSMITRLFPPEHVEYFTAEGLAALAARADLEVLRASRRALASSEIKTAAMTRAGVLALEAVDRLRGTDILLTTVLRARG